MQPTHKTQDIKQLYDESAQSYEKIAGFANLLLMGRLRKQLFTKASGKILEVGVGSGQNFQYFPADCEVVGIDLSPAMLELASMHAQKLKIKASFYEMDAEHLDFPDAAFDTVTSSLSLCIYPHPIAALREMARVCKPGGKIIMLEHGRSQNARIARFQDQREDMFVNVVGCHWNRDITRLAHEAGLKIIQDHQVVMGMFHSLEMMPGQRTQGWMGIDEGEPVKEAVGVPASLDTER